MPIILSLCRLLCLFLGAFLVTNCTFSLSPNHNDITDSVKNAPKGSYIIPYIHKMNPHKAHYKILLNKNLGEKRFETEIATLTIPAQFKKLSFELSSDDSLNSLKTPIKLIDIVDSYNKSIISLHLHNKIYWVETADFHEKISLFLDQEPQKFIIQNDELGLMLMINKTHYIIPVNNNNPHIKIGLIRSDLLRYRGQVIPAQCLYINNIQIINHND